jgi:hypothetical protein
MFCLWGLSFKLCTAVIAVSWLVCHGLLFYYLVARLVSHAPREMTGRDKHTSLLHRNVKYDRIVFYCTDPWCECYKTVFLRH